MLPVDGGLDLVGAARDLSTDSDGRPEVTAEATVHAVMGRDRLLKSLENDHVAKIYDQGFAGEYPYIAMEFLPSGTLAAPSA